MDLQTRDITPDEFREFTGIDLTSTFNESDTPEMFLNRVKVRMETYLDANYHKCINKMYPEFTDYQKEHYKYALIEQALYIIQNSDISVDSGYDPESGVIASRGTLKELALSTNAKEHLIVCGLLTRKINARNSGRIGFFPFWW